MFRQQDRSSIASKRKIEKPLSGLVFAITGTLSVPRAKFEAYITQHGGSVAKSVTNACTHLVSAETGTKKCQDAEEKGIAIVDEDWVRNKVEGNGESGTEEKISETNTDISAHGGIFSSVSLSSSNDVPKKEESNHGKAFHGRTFRLHASFDEDTKSMLRTLIEENGGTVSDSILACDHFLVCPTANNHSAFSTVITDQQVMDAICGGDPLPADKTKDIKAAGVSNFVAKGSPGISLYRHEDEGQNSDEDDEMPKKSRKSNMKPKADKPLQGMTICITGIDPK
jgi:hypothetical protein